MNFNNTAKFVFSLVLFTQASACHAPIPGVNSNSQSALIDPRMKSVVALPVVQEFLRYLHSHRDQLSATDLQRIAQALNAQVSNSTGKISLRNRSFVQNLTELLKNQSGNVITILHTIPDADWERYTQNIVSCHSIEAPIAETSTFDADLNAIFQCKEWWQQIKASSKSSTNVMSYIYPHPKPGLEIFKVVIHKMIYDSMTSISNTHLLGTIVEKAFIFCFDYATLTINCLILAHKNRASKQFDSNDIALLEFLKESFLSIKAIQLVDLERTTRELLLDENSAGFLILLQEIPSREKVNPMRPLIRIFDVTPKGFPTDKNTPILNATFTLDLPQNVLATSLIPSIVPTNSLSCELSIFYCFHNKLTYKFFCINCDKKGIHLAETTLIPM